MPHSNVDVSAVVVHYETPELLAQSLDALRASVGVSLEAIVVDNASRGFSPKLVEDHFPGARTISNSSNRGFAVAANEGLRVGSGRYLLLLNADTIVEPNTLVKLVAYLEMHPTVGCATARLNLSDGSLDLACRRLFPTPERALYRMTLLSRLMPRSRTFGQYNLTYLPEDRETEIDAPCGAFMMVRAEIRESVGLLDERYFMYGEDLDWAYRIKRAGWKIVVLPGGCRHARETGRIREKSAPIHPRLL